MARSVFFARDGIAASKCKRVTLLEADTKSSTIDIKLCIDALSSEDRIAITRKGKPSRPMDKKDEIVANVIWRFLDVRG